jgi:hypothetical protein
LGIVREDRGTADIENLDPDDVAPMVVYLASELAGDVNGRCFLCYGNTIALVSQPRPVKTPAAHVAGRQMSFTLSVSILPLVIWARPLTTALPARVPLARSGTTT